MALNGQSMLGNNLKQSKLAQVSVCRSLKYDCSLLTNCYMEMGIQPHETTCMCYYPFHALLDFFLSFKNVMCHGYF